MRMHVSDMRTLKKSICEEPVDGAHMKEKAMDNEMWENCDGCDTGQVPQRPF